jgi:hypothetical protein
MKKRKGKDITRADSFFSAQLLSLLLSAQLHMPSPCARGLMTSWGVPTGGPLWSASACAQLTLALPRGPLHPVVFLAQKSRRGRSQQPERTTRTLLPYTPHKLPTSPIPQALEDKSIPRRAVTRAQPLEP